MNIIHKTYNYLAFLPLLFLTILIGILLFFYSLILGFNSYCFFRPIDSDNVEINKNIENPTYEIVLRFCLVFSEAYLVGISETKSLFKHYEF